MKPCPSCEWEAQDIVHSGSDTRWQVECIECGACGPLKETQADALSAWDALPRREDTDAALAALGEP